MQVVHIGTQPKRTAPFPNSPNVEILVGEPAADGGNIAAVHILLPSGTQMPPRTHGQAQTLITPLEGRMLPIREQQVTLKPGMLAVIAVGEQVGVENAAAEPASLLAVFAPADFIRTPASWPTVNAADERRGQG
jgi:quercetin dioxygenase-like cupin family protein